jgi:antitoxin component YwqK of YwqJK toxin-antitoxin module
LITFQDDGRTYKSHQVYREDGTLERSGGRLAAGAYQTLYFNAKDGSVQRRLVFSNSSQLDEEESYSDTGTLIEKTEKSGIGELKTTRWSASGILLSEIFDQGDGRRHGKLYYEDGKTVKIEFEHRGYEITANYFDKKGVIEFAVEYVLQGMGVTVYGPGEKALYKQYWLLLSGTTLSDAKYRLVKVEEFDRWGDDRDSHELKRVIGIADDGKTPKIILTPVNTYSYERTETELYPDGSVKSEKVYDSSNQVVSDKSFNQGEQKVDIKPELFIKPVFEPLDPPESKYKTASPSEEGEPTED